MTTITIPANEHKKIVLAEPGEYFVYLTGAGAEAEISGVFEVDQDTMTQVSVIIHHQAPHTRANTTLKGVARDTASLKFVGRIIIDEECGDSNSFLTERILLLSDGAKAEAVPDLEIKTDDVKCSHAASISRIPEEHLFYLQSRGLARAEAEKLIVDGFLDKAWYNNYMFDPQEIKHDFPILAKQVHGKPLVYLDNAATSQKPRAVIEAITNYYENHNANVHRGVHQLGDESTRAFHESRKTIADFFGADVEELVIVRNTTEAINQVAYTWGEASIHQDDVILVSELEHHSNLVPWQELAKRKQARLISVPVTATGSIDFEFLRTFDFQHTQVKLIALTHISNTTGSVLDIKQLVNLISDVSPETKILIDGAQAAPHISLDFAKMGVDFYVVSAHKMLGPMGIGALLVRKNLLVTLSPFLFGGGMIDEVSMEKTTFAENLEERMTAGTPDVAGLVGWAAACEYLTSLDMTAVFAHDQDLVKYALEKLQEIPEITLIGSHTPEDRVGSVAFVYNGVHAHDVGQVLDSEGVAVRSGHHCTMPLHVKFGWQATVRVSFQVYTTRADIDALVAALGKVKKVFGKWVKICTMSSY